MSRTLETLVQTMRRTDLSSVEIDDLVRELRPLIAGHTIQAPEFATGTILFRGRLAAHVERVQELSHPPPALTQIGRLNRSGMPLFYASPSRSAIFFELPVRVGSTVLVSRWRTRAPMLLNHLGYHSQVFERLGSSRPAAGWDGRPAPQTDGAAERTWNALGLLFTERVPDGEDFRYKLSAAVAECMFDEKFAGVLYPSVAMTANADNVALRPAWADANLAFIGVEKIKVNAIEGVKMQINVVDYATSPDGVGLHWKGRGPNWQIRETGATLTMVSTGEIWRAFDSNGNEVDPE